jgi:hypothetical protein
MLDFIHFFVHYYFRVSICAEERGTGRRRPGVVFRGGKEERVKERTGLVQSDATTGPGRLVSLRDIAMVRGNL